ncbi:hypothetical protein [Microbacterium hominis]|jgi:hypothetical protein|uniref:hypothetical protein n=1 Tax=Microbacterium hominis TaxID=162426 RepID=UPI00076866A0|nr:hypothetical protein [Microbacterium hominis]KXC06525.1 hypothetical protein MhomT_05130 [Microbacterium hominis]
MEFTQMTAAMATMGDENPLVGLGGLTQLRGEVERAEAVLVRRSRNAGATWVQIAAALGVSKQAVHQKYAGRGLLGGRG